MKRVVLGAALFAECAAMTPARMRETTAVIGMIDGASYDAINGCVADIVVARFHMTFVPAEFGSTYYFRSTGSTMMVDVARGTPPTATVRLSGGPWLGQQRKLLRLLAACQGR